jgi:DNA replication protein DnaC
MTPNDRTQLDAQLQRLHLQYIQGNYQTFAGKAAEQQRSHVDYLAQLVEGEFTLRELRNIERRIKNARFPVRETLDDFQWSWPAVATPRFYTAKTHSGLCSFSFCSVGSLS